MPSALDDKSIFKWGIIRIVVRSSYDVSLFCQTFDLVKDTKSSIVIRNRNTKEKCTKYTELEFGSHSF